METPRPALLFERESIRAFLTPRGSEQTRFTVYRIYRDLERKQLIYAGATTQPRSRLLSHLAAGIPGVVVELEFFRNTTAMAAAEVEAMQETMEKPTIAQRHGAWKARRRKTPGEYHIEYAPAPKKHVPGDYYGTGALPADELDPQGGPQ